MANDSGDMGVKGKYFRIMGSGGRGRVNLQGLESLSALRENNRFV